MLTLDIVVNDRAGDTLFRANLSKPIGSGVAGVTPDQFADPDRLVPVPDNVRSIAPSPVFGVPGPPVPAGGAPTSVIDLLRRLASETSPRIGPRLPTMARFPTLVVVATDSDGDRTWDAVVTGAKWGRESRCAGDGGQPRRTRRTRRLRSRCPRPRRRGVRHRPDRIAARAATAAVRRWRAGVDPLRRRRSMDAPAEPDSDDATPGQSDPRTWAVAVLRTVAIAAESPELTIPTIPMPAADASVHDLVDDLADELGVTPPSVDIAREQEMVREIRREFHWSWFGSRDVQWALRRAVRQARNLVFVASPQFARDGAAGRPTTGARGRPRRRARDADAGAPQLLVAVCVPRWPDHATAFAGWVRQAFRARRDAIQALTDIDAERVVAFHPRGFPGRAAAIRTTTVVVDDAWLLSGTSHWRRRGMTFDEGVDVVGFDRRLDDSGASVRVRDHRRALMADLAGVSPGEPEFIRLFGTRTCVDVIADLVGQGGLGRLAPFWPGPTDTDVVEQTDDVADPDGGTSADYLALFAGLLDESP